MSIVVGICSITVRPEFKIKDGFILPTAHSAANANDCKNVVDRLETTRNGLPKIPITQGDTIEVIRPNLIMLLSDLGYLFLMK